MILDSSNWESWFQIFNSLSFFIQTNKFLELCNLKCMFFIDLKKSLFSINNICAKSTPSLTVCVYNPSNTHPISSSPMDFSRKIEDISTIYFYDISIKLTIFRLNAGIYLYIKYFSNTNSTYEIPVFFCFILFINNARTVYVWMGTHISMSYYSLHTKSCKIINNKADLIKRL